MLRHHFVIYKALWKCNMNLLILVSDSDLSLKTCFHLSFVSTNKVDNSSWCIIYHSVLREVEIVYLLIHSNLHHWDTQISHPQHHFSVGFLIPSLDKYVNMEKNEMLLSGACCQTLHEENLVSDKLADTSLFLRVMFRMWSTRSLLWLQDVFSHASRSVSNPDWWTAILSAF